MPGIANIFNKISVFLDKFNEMLDSKLRVYIKTFGISTSEYVLDSPLFGKSVTGGSIIINNLPGYYTTVIGLPVGSSELEQKHVKKIRLQLYLFDKIDINEQRTRNNLLNLNDAINTMMSERKQALSITGYTPSTYDINVMNIDNLNKIILVLRAEYIINIF